MIELGDYPLPSPAVLQLFEELYPTDSPLRELLLSHSLSVGRLALDLSVQRGLDLQFVAEASLLHDIGISRTHAPGIHCHGDQHYLLHGVIGGRDCSDAKLLRHAVVCETHVGTGLTAAEALRAEVGLPHRDMLPGSPEERVICYADKFFSKTSQDRLPLEVVRRKIHRHGEAALQRFESLHHEFSAR